MATIDIHLDQVLIMNSNVWQHDIDAGNVPGAGAYNMVLQVTGNAKQFVDASGQPGGMLQGLMLLGEQSQLFGLPFPDPTVVGVSNGAHLEEILKSWP